MTDPQERRRAPRGPHEAALISKVISCTDPSILPGRTFISRMADISQQGMRIRLNGDVVIGAVLELWIVSHHHAGTLVLNGTVRWVRPVPQDGFTRQAGIELASMDPQEMARWQQIVDDLVPSGPRPATP